MLEGDWPNGRGFIRGRFLLLLLAATGATSWQSSSATRLQGLRERQVPSVLAGEAITLSCFSMSDPRHSGHTGISLDADQEFELRVAMTAFDIRKLALINNLIVEVARGSQVSLHFLMKHCSYTSSRFRFGRHITRPAEFSHNIILLPTPTGIA